MTPRDVFRQVRMSAEINDNAEVKYSDYQMVAALNSVLSMVYNALSNQNSSILTREDTLELDDYEADLPSDFLSLVAVFDPSGTPLTIAGKSAAIGTNTYRIMGNKIYSLNSLLTLQYKAWFIDVEYDTMDDDLELPAYFGELLRKYAVIVLTGGISKADTPIVEQVESDVRRLTAGRDYNSIDVSFDNTSNAGWAGAI